MNIEITKAIYESHYLQPFEIPKDEQVVAFRIKASFDELSNIQDWTDLRKNTLIKIGLITLKNKKKISRYKIWENEPDEKTRKTLSDTFLNRIQISISHNRGLFS
jgi:hypothetical protein